MNDNFLEKTYAEVNDNIKFSEAKNAALITLNSALIAAGADKVFDINIAIRWRVLISGVLLLLIVPLIISLLSFRATTDSEDALIKSIYSSIYKHNKIQVVPSKYMYYAYVAKFYDDNNSSKYLTDIGIKDSSLEEQQLARQIIDLSKVAYRKFALFNLSIRFEISLLFLGGLSALAIVVFKFVSL